ncbi:hypothetical protein [Streptomyces sp. V1I1]|nr:hypothetical protein [Streptomyces sp. V1I1]MDQ0944746.1 hypothetical protein [Streptomyces sp. V1I1]
MSDARAAAGLQTTSKAAPLLPLPSAGGTPSAGGEAIKEMQ